MQLARLAHVPGAHQAIRAAADCFAAPLGRGRAAHIWWGVSVEDRKHGLPRIADLQATPAAVRFLSVEPLLEDLGELDLEASAG